jgi:hypothetical protein
METIQISKALADAAREFAALNTNEPVLAVNTKGRPGFMFGTFKDSRADDEFQLAAMTLLEAESHKAQILTASPTNGSDQAASVTPSEESHRSAYACTHPRALLDGQRLTVCYGYKDPKYDLLIKTGSPTGHVREI